MSRELAQERAALQAITSKVEQVKTASPAEEASSDPNDKLKSLARRANTMRRQYMNEIDGLKSQIAALKGTIIVSTRWHFVDTLYRV